MSSFHKQSAWLVIFAFLVLLFGLSMQYANAGGTAGAAPQQRPGARAWSKIQRDYYDTGYRLGRRDRRDNRARDYARFRGKEFDKPFEPFFREGYADGYDGLPKKYSFPAADSERLEPTGERWKVKCETLDVRRECPAPVAGNVTILRVIGGANCVEGQNWGWSSRGFWVDRGCRAEFGFDAGRSILEPPGPRERRVVKCESTDGRRRECPAPVAGRIMIIRLIEFSVCAEGQSWGWSNRGIWVDRGCRAEFEYDVFTGTPPSEAEAAPPSAKSQAPVAERWGDAERQAYDAGYQRGRNDFRNNLTSDYRRYFNEFTRALEPYYRKGYEHGFEGLPKQYKL